MCSFFSVQTRIGDCSIIYKSEFTRSRRNEEREIIVRFVIHSERNGEVSGGKKLRNHGAVVGLIIAGSKLRFKIEQAAVKKIPFRLPPELRVQFNFIVALAHAIARNLQHAI